MKKILVLIATFLTFTLFSGVTFSAPVCPVLPEMIDLEVEKERLSSAAILNTEACFDARATRTESTITDFTCPSGDFIGERPLTDEVLAYMIAVSAVFQAIDTNSMQYAKNLQCNRDTDVIKWQQTIRDFTDAYKIKYQSTCDLAYIMSLLNVDPERPYIKTTETFPQADCMILA